MSIKNKILEMAKEYLRQEKLKDIPKVFIVGKEVIPLAYILTEFAIYFEHNFYKND